MLSPFSVPVSNILSPFLNRHRNSNDNGIAPTLVNTSGVINVVILGYSKSPKLTNSNSEITVEVA